MQTAGRQQYIPACALHQRHLSSRLLPWRAPNPATRASRQIKSRDRLVQCRTGGRQQAEAAEVVVSVPPPQPQPPSQQQFMDTWQFKAGAVLVLLGAARVLLRGLNRRSSLSDLEDRGYLDDARENADPYLEDIMKNVNKVDYGELTEEQIETARRRRARGIADYRKASEVEVPDNHPFATKKELTPEEEELIRQRLAVKRGAPVQDLSGRRGYPGIDNGPGAAQ